MRQLFLLLAILPTLLQAEPEQWLRYPAISPDGKTLVFTHGADLYTVPSSGGTASQLTQHLNREFHPVWSPDSQHIAFASDRHGNHDIFTIPATGGPAQRLTFHSQEDIPWSFSADGKAIIFSSTRLDSATAIDIPNHRMSELYQISLTGGQPTQLLTTPAEELSISPDRKKYLYQDRKGYENIWRKHHTSSVARDIWLFDLEKNTHRQLTTFPGEDRDPVWIDDSSYLYLSEQSGSFNIWQHKLTTDTHTQITKFDRHPVRFLSRANDGTVAFSFHGALYTLKDGQAQKLKISLKADAKINSTIVSTSEAITEMTTSPDGKEIAFIARGEVFVTSVDHKTTRRITNTPQQERSVDFHPDGRSLVYASERDESWNLYTTSLTREDEKHFHLATALTEKPLLVTDDETFQPLYSPDGKSIAYLLDRENITVLDIASGQSTTIVPASQSYSYSDGDISYVWSPDSQNLAVMALQKNRWAENIYLAPANGKGELIDLTRNGYYDASPAFAWSGEAVTWVSNRHGKKSHGSWGFQYDIYASFLTNRSHRLFKLDETERKLIDDEAWKKLYEEKKPLDPTNAPERVERLTIHSTSLSDYTLSPDGQSLYYLTSNRKKYHLWVRHFYKDETKKLASFGKADSRKATHLEINEKGDTLFLLAGGSLSKVKIADGKVTAIGMTAEMNVNRSAERAEMFTHIWRQTREKFHRSDLHGVDWDFYRKEYQKLLPAITNNYDFTELLSELLGELNASHTGARYSPKIAGADQTAALGIFLDPSHQAAGLKILEVIDRSPLALLDQPLPPGTLITALNGTTIPAGINLAQLLNRLTPDGKERNEVIKPISLREQSNLLYHRWVKRMRARTDELSGGKIGWVHIQGMNDSSFRDLFSQVWGYHSDKKALIVDTRFNGGGWLTEDLTSFLSGQPFLRFYPREQEKIGGEPIFRWDRPSAAIISEGNYSDAHLFPYAYQTLGIGKLIGMPVAGTGTAVWWERLIDQSCVFGIPQTSTLDTQGRYLENTQLEPDIKVNNTPEQRAQGNDAQLQKAIDHLLSLPDPKPWPKPK